MTEREPERQWMLPLLDILYDEYTEIAAVRLLRDGAARAAVLPLLVTALEKRTASPNGLMSATGDTLLQGLLALRAKFPWEEAREKVRLNIAMRDGER